MDLVTIEEAARHLRLDSPDDDLDLQLKIAAASGAVLTYLKSSVTAWILDGELILDENDVPLLPVQVKQATLLLLGYFYKDRDENADGAYEMGFLPKPVTALLYPLRDPALA